MSKQWGMVLVIVAGLGLGAAALVRFGPKLEGVEVGKRAPDYRTVRLGTQDSVSVQQEAKGIPCRAEMPAMEKLYRELGPKGLRILAVSIDDGDAKDVRSFVDELGLTFEILHDASGDIQRIYQTTGVPESFLLDRNGVIVKKVIGEHPWASPSNQRIIADLLGGD
jgi:cytochrome c biogenesis protein CcmG, thiol:disulfide interchange protein DsbE